MNHTVTSTLLALTLITSCATTGSTPPNPDLVRGTSKETVTATLGPPLRVEKHRDGIAFSPHGYLAATPRKPLAPNHPG